MGGGRGGKGRGGKGAPPGGKGKGTVKGATPQAGAGAKPFVKGMAKAPTWTCSCGQAGVWRCRPCCPVCGALPSKAIQKEQAEAAAWAPDVGGNSKKLQEENASLKKALKEALESGQAMDADSDSEGPVDSQKVLAAAHKKAAIRLAKLKELAKDTPDSTHAQGWVADAEAAVASAKQRLLEAIPQEQRVAKLHAAVAAKAAQAAKEKHLLQALQEERTALDLRIREQEGATEACEKELGLLSAELQELALSPAPAGATQEAKEALAAACKEKGLEEHGDFILELVQRAVRGSHRPRLSMAEATQPPSIQGNVFTFKDGLEMELGVPQNAATVEEMQAALTQWQVVQGKIASAKGNSSAEGLEAPGGDNTDAQGIPALEDQAKSAWTTVLKGMGKSLRPRVVYSPY